MRDVQELLLQPFLQQQQSQQPNTPNDDDDDVMSTVLLCHHNSTLKKDGDDNHSSSGGSRGSRSASSLHGSSSSLASPDTVSFLVVDQEEQPQQQHYQRENNQDARHHSHHHPEQQQQQQAACVLPCSLSSSSLSSSTMIDNSTLLYIPIRLPCGVVTFCRPDVLSQCPQVLQELNGDLQQCLNVMLPKSVHRFIRRNIKIWINVFYRYGLQTQPTYLNHSTAHHHQGWLVWARDNPKKAGGIEIYSCWDYLRMRDHWNGCGLILHELCHLIHQFVLPNGLDNDNVKAAYQQHALHSGIYDQTLRRDWAGLPIDYDMAYAMVNHKEFFAEMSVTYLSKGYSELDHADRTSMNLCCPPLFMPTVIDRVRQQQQHSPSMPFLQLELRRVEYLERLQQQQQQQRWLWRLLLQIPRLCCPEKQHQQQQQHQQEQLGRPLPCNKFYPFTSGQLKHCDPKLYQIMAYLWRQIHNWKDEHSDNDDGMDDDDNEEEFHNDMVGDIVQEKYNNNNCWWNMKQCLPK